MRARKNILGPVCVLLAVGFVTFAAGNAIASVSDPANYTVSTPVGGVSKWQGPTASFDLNVTDIMDGDIAADGSWSNVFYNFPVSSTGLLSTASTTIYAYFNVSSGSASWLYDAAYDVDITLSGRLEFTWSGQTQQCHTGSFSVTVSTTKTYDPSSCSCSVYGSGYGLTTGRFIANATDFAVSNITSTSLCDNAGNRGVINAALLGSVGSVGITLAGYADQTSSPGTYLAP